MKVTVTLENEDYDVLHDLILEALGFTPSLPQIDSCWNLIPEDIKGEAIQWGTSDTVARDNIYVWLIDNKETILPQI